jgi:ribosomal-protein-alanine N-acetyltransferase
MRLRDALPATIATKRLRLRIPVMADRDAIVEGANNWNVIEPTASLPFPYLAEHAEGFIEKVTKKPDQRPYAIAGAETDQLMGIVGLKFDTDKPPELGYWLAEKYWGQGFAPEAVAGLLFAASATGIDTIRARVLASNPASARVLEKTGFTVIEHTQSVVERHRGKPLLILEWRA